MKNKIYRNKMMRFSLMLFSSFLIWSCEAEADRLGEQFFNKIEVEDTSYDLIAYNVDNKDTVRADNSSLGYAVLGAFSENVFGAQKASYVSQIRLNTYDPSFGTNPTVDSAVLVLKPLYDASSITEKNSDYIFPEGNVEATKTVKTFSVHSYGKATIPGGAFTVNVQEVSEYLGGVSEASYSNRAVAVNPEIIGTAKFNGKVTQVDINKKSDNTSLYTQDVSFRIPLSTSFIKEKIVDKQGGVQLSDAANFVRYFKGLKISVEESDGYLFRFDPSTVQVIVYYKHDKTTNGTTEKVRSNFTMSLGAGNARVGQYSYDRTDSSVASALASSNVNTGDAKLFLQGMGGSSIGIRIPSAVISTLKEKFQKDKAAILGATIRLYTDDLWKNDYGKPETFVFLEKNASAFLPEMSAFNAVANYSMIKMKDTSTQSPYYDIVVTQSLKNRVELEAINQDFVLKIGSWRINPTTNTYYGYQYNSSAYTLERTVLVGTDINSDKRIKLHITYAK